MKDYNAQQKEIARLQRIVDRFKNKPTKVSMAHSKEKAIEHMVKLEAPDRFDTGHSMQISSRTKKPETMCFW